MGFTQIWLPPPNKAAEKDGRGYDAYDLWDLGEFKQKGLVETRWGSRKELLSACNAAKNHGIDILIDAVLNVWILFNVELKHKIGADRVERFPAVPVDEQNRLKDIGPEREIEVIRVVMMVYPSFFKVTFHRDGLPLTSWVAEKRLDCRLVVIERDCRSKQSHDIIYV
ncbi:hypothetical protein C0989_005978 [Termitomyces sp. Mn162]|nr:hypothetical protein C0989_005978 [Termitomyces sp. Mn162]